jgi:hypothetical protein
MDEFSLTPGDSVTRCDICGKPFIYGMATVVGGEITTFEKGDDPGGKQADGSWTHNRCYEGSK